MTGPDALTRTYRTAQYVRPGGVEHEFSVAGPGAAPVVTVDRAFADQVAEVARLLDSDDVPDETLRRLTRLGAELVPGGRAAAVTVDSGGQGLTFAASDARLDELHRVQSGGTEGPVAETLRHNEPRRIDDTAREHRWPAFCRAAARAGFGSCLVLPLRTDRRPAGAIALYGHGQAIFTGAAHDTALLFAAQGGTAVRNAALYQQCREMIGNLHTALESRAAIEQAKGILHAETGVSPAEAFELLSRFSQDHNRKVRKVAADLIEGRIASREVCPRPRR